MPFHDLEHPALDQLAATPEILRLLMAGVTEEVATRKPAPDRWSIAEVLEHLSHVEGHLFRARLDQMLATDNPTVEDYDEKQYDYASDDAEESFAHWEEQRDAAITKLQSLDEKKLKRTARHPELGTFSLEHHLNAWAAHDLSHIRQMAELVRAHVFSPESGPFHAHHNLKP